MSVSNVGVIDTFLDTFTTYIDSGFGLIKGEVTYLSSTLIVIDITLAGLFWAWGADEDVIQRLVKKTLYIGFFAFIIGNFNGLAKIIFNSFAGLGLEAGGSQITLDKFLQPGNIASTGLTVGQGLLDQAAKLSGPVAFFTNLIQILVLIVAALVVLVAFFILAVQLFITLIEFKLTTLAGFVLVPFALFNKTAFLAEKVLGNVVASGIKVMVLAVIVGIGTGLFSQFTTSYGSTQPTTEQALSTALAALALLGLGIFGPGIATGLVSGAPQLGAGAAVGTGLAVAGTAMLGGAALGAAGRGAVAAASSAGAAARGGASLAGATSAAYTLGANGRSGMAGVASGMGGVGRTAGGAAVRTAAAPFKRAADAMKESFQAGARSVSGAGEGGSVAGSTGGGDGSTGDPPAAGAPGGGPDTPGGPGDGPSSGSAPTGKADSKPPAWARRMKRSQAMSHGASAAANAVKSGDSHGGGHSVDLSEKDS